MSAIRTFALAAVAAAALAGSAQAQSTTTNPVNQPVAGQRAHRGRRGDKMGLFKNLNLTDAQKTQVKAIRAKYKPQLTASRAQAKPYIEAARAARQKGDTASFRANMEKARQTSSAIRQQEMNEIRGVLTPEQRAKADAAIAQRKQERGNHARRGGRNRQWGKNKRVKSGS